MAADVDRDPGRGVRYRRNRRWVIRGGEELGACPGGTVGERIAILNSSSPSTGRQEVVAIERKSNSPVHTRGVRYFRSIATTFMNRP